MSRIVGHMIKMHDEAKARYKPAPEEEQVQTKYVSPEQKIESKMSKVAAIMSRGMPKQVVKPAEIKTQVVGRWRTGEDEKRVRGLNKDTAKLGQMNLQRVVVRQVPTQNQPVVESKKKDLPYKDRDILYKMKRIKERYG
jgi:hypothetical protein